MNIVLEDYEMVQGANTGSLRHIASIKKGYKNKIKLESSWNTHIEGACGEIAVSKAFGKYWGGSINTFKRGGDVDSTKWEVRTRSKHNYDLILRNDDPQDRIYFLVTGLCPNYEIKGWIKGNDGMKQEYLHDHGNYGEAYFVPQEHLNNIKDLEVN